MCNRVIFVCLALCVGLFMAPDVSPAAGPKLKARLGEVEQARRPIFHFAVVADRTGGQRHGVFPRAVNALNLLRPELVMSVGDMIEGYTANERIVSGQWDAMEKDLAALKAPFYYTAGNHDISNPAMGRMFMQRYGKPFYSFVHRQVLFIVLNSEQRHVEGGFEAQQEFLARTLAEHDGVRWTFVFFHQPVWRHREGPQWWRDAAKLLERRDHTVFAGHWHQYAKKVRGRSNYYTLATTGGGSDLSGPESGSFDHVVWVSVTPQGPVVANVLLDGVLPDDVLTEVRQELTDKIRHRAFRAHGVLFDKKPFRTGRTSLTLRNPCEVPLSMSLEMTATDGLSVAPGRLEQVLAPGATKRVELAVEAAGRPDGDVAGMIDVEWRARIEEGDNAGVAVSSRRRLGVEVLHPCWSAAKAISVDGRLVDWPDHVRWHDEVMQKLGRGEAWTGPEDCRYRLATAYDDRYVYVAVDVRDDRHVFDEETMPWSQDGVEVRLQIDQGDVGRQRMLLVALSGSRKPEQMVWFRRNRMPEGVQAICVQNDDGYVAEIAVPVAWLNKVAGGPWKRFRLNLAVNDTDDPKQGTAKLWWRPDWRSAASYAGSGTFERK